MVSGLLERTRPEPDVYADLSHELNLPLLERLQSLLPEVSCRRIHPPSPSIAGSVIGTYCDRVLWGVASSKSGAASLQFCAIFADEP